ncbi:MAG: PDZ domain-containing protein [Sphingobacteriales bacterium]|nr:PDZ domain-containing protein [Sphingobacteriales bacterium]
MKKIITLIVIGMMANTVEAEKISYQLTFPEAQGHYVNVTMDVKTSKDEVVVKMPVWAPGSYLVREFARQVEGFNAKAGGTSLSFVKRDKNTWVIKNPTKSAISISYKVYAFELTVRTSFIDESHAYLNGTSIFMYVDGQLNQASEILITPNSNWSKISCALPSEKNNTYHLYAENYDILADSPIEIGNQTIIEFTAQGVKHSVAMIGPGNYDAEKIKKDFAKIVDEATSVFGTHPCKNYTFFVHNVPAGGGGLEHLNSTTVQVQRFAYSNEATYQSFLGLVAHEYFHLWNVKRLRPVVLGPFNYDVENYTRMLWVSEGFTAFYDNWLVKRAGYNTPEKYLDIIANEYSAQTNLPGDKEQSVADASFDAWIKYYRRNENSNNTQVSYYDKGSIIASLLNLMIIEHSGAKQNLDNLMSYLYEEYYKKKNTGFTDEQFKVAAEKFTGKNLDEFYKNYVNGVEAIPYESYLKIAGLKLTDLNASKNEAYLGANSTNTNGKVMITSVAKNSPAYTFGINVNDEILAIDNYRTDDLTKALSYKKAGDKISILLSRDGMTKTIDVTLVKNTSVKYKIEKIATPSPEQEAAYKQWIR